MDPIVLLIALLAGAAVAVLFVQLYGQTMSRRELIRARVMGDSDGGLLFAPGSVLRQPRTRFRLLAALPLSGEANERMARDLGRAGWQLRPGEYVGIRLIAAALGMLLGIVGLTRLAVTDAVPLILGTLGAAYAGFLVPRLALNAARKRRREKIDDQLPDALTSMAKSLRTGAGILQALAYTARETPAPLGEELQRVIRDLELGGEAEEVFAALAERVGSPDLDIAVTAIVIQRTVGGNLSEILMNVTNTIRSRANLYREVRIITTRQRMTSNMVAGVPVVVSGLLLIVNPKMAALLFGTTPGRIALAVGIGFELFGIFLVRKFGTVEV